LNVIIVKIILPCYRKFAGLNNNTLASETMPFSRVAAASYSGARRLQWPHLKVNITHEVFYLVKK